TPAAGKRTAALWERGYFVMSSGTGTTDEMIRQYIKDQRLHSDANDQASEARSQYGEGRLVVLTQHLVILRLCA
ncbi:MAG: transposase, partial [Desulfobacteraceae bacterium]|nr:transposase [Desulfobacteraceae bacterium]